jgi:hypothetical protein
MISWATLGSARGRNGMAELRVALRHEEGGLGSF